MSATAPFEPGSISMRLYPHTELGATGAMEEICRQAGLALDAGFDGVMTSEHHGGFAGYIPNPLQMTTFILEDNQAGWAAPWSTPDHLARLSASFDEAGGTGGKVLIRRVWLGERRREEIDRQRKIYETYSSADRPFAEDQTVSAPDGGELADRLAAVVGTVGADALNLRLHLVGLPPEAIREQITALGEAVLPRLRRALSP